MLSDTGCLQGWKRQGQELISNQPQSAQTWAVSFRVVRAIPLAWPKLQLFSPIVQLLWILDYFVLLPLCYFVLLPLVLAFDNSSIALLSWNSTSNICSFLEKFRSKKADLTVAVNSSSRWQIYNINKVSSLWPILVSALEKFREGRTKDWFTCSC